MAKIAMKFSRIISRLTALCMPHIPAHIMYAGREMNACVQYKLNTRSSGTKGMTDQEKQGYWKNRKLSVWRKRIYKNDTGKSIVGISLWKP